MFMHNFCSCYIKTTLRLYVYVLVHRNILMYNWASEASPTLGCSIEISRDIYMYIYIYVCLSYVKSRGIT